MLSLSKKIFKYLIFVVSLFTFLYLFLKIANLIRITLELDLEKQHKIYSKDYSYEIYSYKNKLISKLDSKFKYQGNCFGPLPQPLDKISSKLIYSSKKK